jgi:hypothetical protein
MAVVYHNSCDPWAYFVDECERYETEDRGWEVQGPPGTLDRRGVT